LSSSSSFAAAYKQAFRDLCSELSLSHTHAWLRRRFRLFLSVFSSRGIYLELLVSPSVIPLHLNLELSLTAAYSVSVEGASALQQVLEGGFQ
jgi:hypothetical protein